LVLAPQLETANHELDVDAIGTIRRANDPRLTAGARARVARAPCVDERDVRAAPQEVQRCPAAERAGADDNDVRTRFGGVHQVSDALDGSLSLTPNLR